MGQRHGGCARKFAGNLDFDYWCVYGVRRGVRTWLCLSLSKIPQMLYLIESFSLFNNIMMNQ